METELPGWAWILAVVLSAGVGFAAAIHLSDAGGDKPERGPVAPHLGLAVAGGIGIAAAALAGLGLLLYCFESAFL